LDSFVKQQGVHKIDILWMDIQGGELKALQGLGSYISIVDCIHTEVEFMDIYANQPLFRDVKRFCEANGFIFSGFTWLGGTFGDAIFVNKQRLGSFEKLGFRMNGFRGYSAFCLKTQVIPRIAKITSRIRKLLPMKFNSD
jgi:hypothetical protein